MTAPLPPPFVVTGGAPGGGGVAPRPNYGATEREAFFGRDARFDQPEPGREYITLATTKATFGLGGNNEADAYQTDIDYQNGVRVGGGVDPVTGQRVGQVTIRGADAMKITGRGEWGARLNPDVRTPDVVAAYQRVGNNTPVPPRAWRRVMWFGLPYSWVGRGSRAGGAMSMVERVDARIERGRNNARLAGRILGSMATQRVVNPARDVVFGRPANAAAGTPRDPYIPEFTTAPFRAAGNLLRNPARGRVAKLIGVPALVAAGVVTLPLGVAAAPIRAAGRRR